VRHYNFIQTTKQPADIGYTNTKIQHPTFFTWK